MFNLLPGGYFNKVNFRFALMHLRLRLREAQNCNLARKLYAMTSKINNWQNCTLRLIFVEVVLFKLSGTPFYYLSYYCVDEKFCVLLHEIKLSLLPKIYSHNFKITVLLTCSFFHCVGHPWSSNLLNIDFIQRSIFAKNLN